MQRGVCRGVFAEGVCRERGARVVQRWCKGDAKRAVKEIKCLKGGKTGTPKKRTEQETKKQTKKQRSREAEKQRSREPEKQIKKQTDTEANRAIRH